MSQANPASRPRRRWGLSLRALMGLVLVAGGFLGWEARRASIQRAAVARIREVGGSVAYDYQSSTAGPTPGAAPPAPEWLRRLLGDELFQEVRGVTLQSPPLAQGEPTDATVATVAAIGALDRLEELKVIHSPLTDAQLAGLGPMPALKVALLLDTKLTEKGLSSIRTWPKLETLAVRFDRDVPAAMVLAQAGAIKQLKLLNVSPLRDTTPADFRHLAGLADLEHLAVRPSPRDESCLESVAGLRRLTGLHLMNTRVTDAGMLRLAPLDRLQRFAVDGEAISDDGLAVVAHWPDLQELSLIRSRPEGSPAPVGVATDRGLDHLAGLGRLETLSISGRFTDAGLATLSRCTKLNSMYLYGIQEAATIDGLRGLLAARSFRSLGLDGPGVRDDWTTGLAGQSQLQILNFAGPQLTDAALGPLAALGSLRYLYLTGGRITDAGLKILAGAGFKLRALHLRATGVTPAGVAAFRAACPSCEVDFEPGLAPP